MSPEDLNAAVRNAFAYAARYVSLLASAGSASAVLGRPDVDAALAEALGSARTIAEDAVRQAWAAEGAPYSPYLEWLLDDVTRTYDALTLLRHTIRDAWQPVPGPRQQAVRAAILDFGAEAAMRNQLTLEVAAVAARTHREILSGQEREQAGERVSKTWRTSRQPPDERTCHWCRALNGITVALHANFPLPEAADLTGHGRRTQPPRPYHGVLPGPPLHPGCRCHLELGVIGEGSQELPETPPRASDFLAAAAVRAMPEQEYQGLLVFLKAAVHELGQVLRQLVRVVRRR